MTRDHTTTLDVESVAASTPLPLKTPVDDKVASTAALATDIARLAAEHDREDLADRLQEVAQRVGRTETMVCVVGEFKKGKSALINALIGSAICPVDDDLATMAVTVVRFAEQPTASVRHRENGELVVEAIATADVPRWVSEREATDRSKVVELVEIGLPNAFLERGITLVDTPGVGGLNAGHAAATLAFLPSADALIFVTDASAELSRPELDFLASAMTAGPPVLVAVTKVDMYPEWRRIVSIDERHLQAAGLAERPFGLSSVLRIEGLELGDAALEEASGFPVFAEALVGDVIDRARTTTAAGILAQIRPALEQLREPPAAELAALERPEAAEEMAAELRDIRSRLTALARADAAWSVRLEDEFATLRTKIEFEFQGRMRQILRDSQDELERIDPARSWPDLSQRVQQETATAVRGAFLQSTNGAADIQRMIADLLSDEDVGMDSAGTPISFDVETLWQGGPTFKSRTKSSVIASFGLVAGATVGVEMLGMLGTLLGAAVAGPAVLGVALVFGGKEVLSERRRQLTDRRQQARAFLAGFVEEVRFETDGRLASLMGEIQRQMRARFTDRIRELHRTYAESAEALEHATKQAEVDRRGRLSELRAELATIDDLMTRAASQGL